MAKKTDTKTPAAEVITPSADATAIVKALQTLNRTLAKSNKISEELVEVQVRMADTYQTFLDKSQPKQTYANLAEKSVLPSACGPESEPVSINGDEGKGGTVEMADPADESDTPGPDAVQSEPPSPKRAEAAAAVGADTLSGVPEDRYEWLIAQVAE